MTREELNPHAYPLTGDMADNFEILFDVCSEIEKQYGKPLKVNRGVSSHADQMRINPAHPDDAHTKAAGVDFDAPKGSDLWDWCIDNLEFLTNLGVYLESRTYTPNHVHMQIYAPKSGHRVFIP